MSTKVQARSLFDRKIVAAAASTRFASSIRAR